jgi:acetylornithine/succinyldiaminopimelate/putrescine aminotransferase
VIFKLSDGPGARLTAAEFASRMKARGVMVSVVGRDAIRLVTHLDVDRGACIAATEALAEVLEAAAVGLKT